MKIIHIINYISFITLAISFGLVILVLYWTFYPYKILEFKNGNAQIENTEVYGGEYLKMHQINCKFTDLQSTINRQFVNTIIYTIPPSYTRRPLGCNDTYELVYIPKAIPPGKYFIRTTISYQVNPIRTVSYTVNTNEFYILEATRSGGIR